MIRVMTAKDWAMVTTGQLKNFKFTCALARRTRPPFCLSNTLLNWQLDDELVWGWGDGEGASTHVTIFRVVQKDDADLSQS
nr:hypothetical protein BgiMline_012005 [Biomphalaria glabrata]